ncbi:FAD-binding oxidoreductase [Candidatus Kaiserbacteria bacterium]|nr:FAD-binding oxidoreductase [Candidatus Kaiserbacteria bacterium]
MTLKESLAALIQGDVADDAETLKKFSRDTSIFTRRPKLVVSPKSTDDVAALVRYVSAAKKEGQDISVTGRSAGTDMSGGPLTDSIVVSFTKYMNHMLDIGSDYAVAEPGMYYRDFEKETLAKNGMLLASYPASRELCALGGIVSNNSAGELTLRYGKTDRYVRELDTVLSDGSKAILRPLSRADLEAKKAEQNLEGEIYRKMHALIEENWQEIRAATPRVSKNSAGYALWNVYDRQSGIFDLTKLITGSQGTLALVTKMKLGLVKPKPHHAMLVVFMSDLKTLPDIVRTVLEHEPESFESYDDQTFKLAVRFLPQILKQLGIAKAIHLGFSFLPEVGMALTGGVPKLILMAEFAEDTHELALKKAIDTRAALMHFPIKMKIAANEAATKKYWTMRRESFALLRKNLHGYYASPFVDDFVVEPSTYPQFLPELNSLLSNYDLIYTIAGHVGNGNFHIIPLMNLADPKARSIIMELTPKVYDLVAKYRGSTTGEHNDGIIRTPFLSKMFSPKMLELFAETKKIFDPQNIFNPGKKVPMPGIGGTEAEIEKYMLKTSG